MKRSNSAAPELSIDDPELLEDGQEEVFSHTAVERGEVYDPPALGPFDADDCAVEPSTDARRNTKAPQAPEG
jgi:hypothetical protein